MENQHEKIKGYRSLNQEELDLINRIKSKGKEFLALHDELMSRLITDTGVKCSAGDILKNGANYELSPECVEWNRFQRAEPLRWLAIGKTDLETAVMAMVRAVAQPDF